MKKRDIKLVKPGAKTNWIFRKTNLSILTNWPRGKKGFDFKKIKITEAKRNYKIGMEEDGWYKTGRVPDGKFLMIDKANDQFKLLGWGCWPQWISAK